MNDDDADVAELVAQLGRIAAALDIPVGCFLGSRPWPEPIGQTRELAALWTALPSEEARERALALIRELTAPRAP